MKRILVLTSSRADFGIYLPLLYQLKADASIKLDILAFGSHLSRYHGHTIDQIKEAGFEVSFTISSLLLGDAPVDIVSSYSLTVQRFADFWDQRAHDFDLVLVLGDRFEMAAAVAAGIPFNVNFAHIHGGETTLGAIDNIYRHSISLASKLHFVALPEFKKRLKSILNYKENIFVVGALGLDNLSNVSLLSIEEFNHKWGINLNKASILITVHPETVAFENNQEYANQLNKALLNLLKDFQLIITLPNADTLGSIYREKFDELRGKYPEKVFLIENFGTASYFTAMKYAKLMLGNTSSGIIEAASFGKYVINLGKRQLGRVTGNNVHHVDFDANSIVNSVKSIEENTYNGDNIYDQGNAAQKILEVIRNYEL